MSLATDFVRHFLVWLTFLSNAVLRIPCSIARLGEVTGKTWKTEICK